MISSYIQAAANSRAVPIDFGNRYFDRRPQRHLQQPTMIKASSGSLGLPTLHGTKSLSSLSLGFPFSLGDGGCGRLSMMMPHQAATTAEMTEAGVGKEEEGEGFLLPNNRTPPCLMVPSGLLLAEGEKEVSFVELTISEMNEKEEEESKEENDNSSSTTDEIAADYYDLLSVEGKKLVLKKKIKKDKNVPLPWQRDILPTDDAICFGSSHGWLAFIHPRNGSTYLYNPLIMDHSFPYIPLPPVETLPCVISSLRRCKNSATSSSITTEYTIPQQISPVSSEHLCQDLFRKIAFSSPPPYSQLHDKDCTVMAIQVKHNHELCFCRIGDPSWTTLRSGGGYQDLVYLSEHQLFYTWNSGDQLEAWDLGDPSSPKSTLITQSFIPYMTIVRKVVQCNSCQRYLAESSGDLLMVQRYSSRANPGKTVAFDVYRVDFVSKQWVHVPSLGDDSVLFVGPNHCQSLSVHDFPPGTFIPDSIYFNDEPLEEVRHGCTDLGFFNLKNKSIYSHHLKKKKKNGPSNTWIVPQLY